MQRFEIPGVTQVHTEREAKRVLKILMSKELRDAYHANDTEGVGIDLKREGPVGHGRVTCFSIYCGKKFDFGNGPRLWINNLDDSEGLIDLFEPYFTAEEIKKVWHNYGFDFHFVGNHGIYIRGFGGDTMHMARLLDAGRMSYKLEHLTEDYLGQRKVPMKELFGRPVLNKNGQPGKKIYLPPADEIQRTDFMKWVDYSTYDTEGLFRLRLKLQKALQAMPWQKDTTMWDFYLQEWLPLGEVLVGEEHRGFTVDREQLLEMHPIALKDRNDAEVIFKKWAVKMTPDAARMNVASDKQLQIFFFGGSANRKTGEPLPKRKKFEVLNTDGYIEPGKKKPKKKRPITLRAVGFEPTDYTKTGWPGVGGADLAQLVHQCDGVFGTEEEAAEAKGAIQALVKVTSIDTLLSNFITPLPAYPDDNGRIHCSLNLNTETGRLSHRRPNEGNLPVPEKDRYGIRDAHTVHSLEQWLRYVPPHLLQLILDTINPQKDELTCLIVADYSQLELRILAHLANCQPMIDAFVAGGDFHSRTAMSMFPNVRKAVEAGDVILEWDKAKGEAPAPLLKEVFGLERGRGKTINFSIGYGKTAVGFAKDWGISEKAAQKYIDTWYEGNPGVESWQDQQIARAYETGYVRTLMGRYRPVPELQHPRRGIRNRGERIVKNTPIQGGAADITNRAMILLERDPWLTSHGYFQIMQVHDEIILEGPQRFRKEAEKRVADIMSKPFKKPLRLPLDVSVHSEITWALAK